MTSPAALIHCSRTALIVAALTRLVARGPFLPGGTHDGTTPYLIRTWIDSSRVAVAR